MTLEELSSAESVIDELGGEKAVCRLTDSKYTAVCNWKYANKFPARMYLVMIGPLHDRGFDAPPSLWGMK